MSRKSLIWIGLFAGSSLGTYIPALWGASSFSLSSAFCSAAGGLLGIWIGYRLGA